MMPQHEKLYMENTAIQFTNNSKYAFLRLQQLIDKMDKQNKTTKKDSTLGRMWQSWEEWIQFYFILLQLSD